MDDKAKECSDFIFIHDFDSGNLGRVEEVAKNRATHDKTSTIELDYEFNIWTRPDCAGTVYENGNRTWFYFGVQCPYTNRTVKLNLMNLNKQGKMYSQGMAPVTRTLPGKPQWERIKDTPTFESTENSCLVSFKYKTPEKSRSTVFFAFTYPFSYIELQMSLHMIDLEHSARSLSPTPADIYYHRECVSYSLENRRVDLLTISSYHGITSEREPHLKNLFPDKKERPFKFENKKIIFISARVHPGETPSSFVFNGFLNLILSRTDPVALTLRKQYVFKLIPFLNPDGVARGHYRTDTKGVNLNRVYLTPTIESHPTIYAARSLIRFHHYGFEKEEDPIPIEESTQLAENYQYYSRSNTALANEIISRPNSTIKSLKNEFNLQQTEKKQPDASQPSKQGRRAMSAPKYSKEKSAAKPIEPLTPSKSLADQVGGLHLSENVELKKLYRNFGKYDAIYASPVAKEPNLKTIEGISSTKDSPIENSFSLILNTVPQGVTSSEDTSFESDNIPNEIKNSVYEDYCHNCQNNLSNIKEKTSALPDCHGERLCLGCQKPILLSDMDVLENSSQDEFLSLSASLEPLDDSKQVYSSQEDEGSISARKDVQKELVAKPQKPPKKKLPRPASKRHKEPESGLFLYLDMHGHASKKGIFMYGNHFEDPDSNVECMLLPKIMTFNSPHFHFGSCNFTERNMYLRDRRDGMSREGSGRVAVLKTTGLIRSYTLECNYNTGRLINSLPQTVQEVARGIGIFHPNLQPPKYNPHIFQEVGKALGASILDLTGQHPNGRIPASEHHNLHNLKEWLRAYTRNSQPLSSPIRGRQRSAPPVKSPNTIKPSTKVKDERKENTFTTLRLENDTKRIIKADSSGNGAKRTSGVKILAMRPRPSDPPPILKTKPHVPQRSMSIVSIKKSSGSLSKTKLSNIKMGDAEQGMSQKLKPIADGVAVKDVKKKKRVKDTVAKNPLMKPLRRLKMTQYKLSDVNRDKFRIKKAQPSANDADVIEMERRASEMCVRSGAAAGSKRTSLQKPSHNTGEMKKIRLKTNIP